MKKAIEKQAANLFEQIAFPRVSCLSVESKIELTDKYCISLTSSDNLLFRGDDSSLTNNVFSEYSSESSLYGITKQIPKKAKIQKAIKAYKI